MSADVMNDLEPGDKVKDKYQLAHPGEIAKALIVLNRHDDIRATEFPMGETGDSLAEVADNWPPEVWSVNLPPGYDPDEDTVVEAVFYESLDRKFGGAWVGWDPEKISRLCELNDVTVYAYHRERLKPV